MATKINIQPPDLNSCKSYEAFKREISAWADVTDLPKQKQGNFIVLSLPNKSKFGDDIKERVLETLSEEDLKSEDGLSKVIGFLDQELGKNAVDDIIEKWEEFDNCKKQDNQTVEDFISDFESKYNRIKASGSKLPEEILAYMIMKRGGLTHMEKMLIIARIDMEDKANLFKNTKINMKNILGKRLQNKDKGRDEIKFEPAFLAEHEEVLAAHGYYRNRANTGPPKPKYYSKGFKKPEFTKRTDKSGKPVNPLGKDGKTMLCKSCGSFRHFVGECPHSHEQKNGVYVTEEVTGAPDIEVDRFILYTAGSEELSRFTAEAINSAALDTACTTTVAGENWIQIYLESLPAYARKQVQGPFPGEKCFKGVGQEVLVSLARYIIPAEMGEHPVMIEVEVVKSDIPLLLSKEAMKKAKMVLHMDEDYAEIFGRKVMLDTTSAGHYVIPLLNRKTSSEINDDQIYNIEEILVVDFSTASKEEKAQTLQKLHKQFGHRPKDSFVTLIKTAGVWTDDMAAILDKIIDGCEGCIKRRRNPDRPAVAMPMATEFNEKVAIDLSFYKGTPILHMVDMHTRLTVSVRLNSKRPSEVIEKIMQKWVAYYGLMGAILSDNGGEFTSEELTEMKSMLDIVNLTTGSESPWQNGLCEKNHAIIDNILERLDEDYPHLDLDSKLAWAGMAKNSLQMTYGFSPNQLVFGTNPRLPNIATGGPSTWEEGTCSESLAKHLNLLHASRREFLKSESCSKLKIALKAKIRCMETVYNNGDIVYYKRARDGKWMGPGKVVFQDGKVIFVRNGATFIRVSANRIVKAGSELAKSILANEDIQEIDHNQNLDTLTDTTSLSVEGNSLSETAQSSEIVEISEDNNNTDNNHEVTTIFSDRIKVKKDDKVRFREGEEWIDATISGRAAKATGKYRNWYNVVRHDGKPSQSVDLEKVEFEILNEIPEETEEAYAVMIPRRDQNTQDCFDAKTAELAKLKEFQTYDEVEDLGQDYISSTWVITDKGGAKRARLVARGFEEEGEIQSDSPTLSKAGMRTFLASAASKEWTVETTDIKSAFLQGSTVERTIFLKPPKEAGCNGKLWKLKKALYGLKDAGRQWFFKVKEELIKLGCFQSDLDPGMFLWKNSAGDVTGMIGLHVDDFLHSGGAEFNKAVIRKIHTVFQVGKNEKGQFMYTGFQIKQDSEGIMIDQNQYLENLEVEDINPARVRHKNDDLDENEKTKIRKMAGSLNWIVRGTRPDKSFELIDASTKFQTGKIEDLVRLRKTLVSMKENKAEIYFPNLGDPVGWTLVCFTDAALGNLNNGKDSTGGHIVLLMNTRTNMCSVLDWQSNKIKRVVRSTLAAEALSLCDGLENAIFLRDVLAEVWNTPEKIKILGVVDNMSVVDAISSTTSVADKRLRREISAIKEMLSGNEVTSIKWVPGKLQLADVLTKRGVNDASLLQVVQEGSYNFDLLNA